MKTKQNNGSIKSVLIAYGIVLLLSMLYFWLFMEPTDGFAFVLIFMLGLIPIMTVAISVKAGLIDSFGKFKWMWALILGFSYMMVSYASFPMANMVATGNLRYPEPICFIIGAVISVVGVFIGSMIRLASQRTRG